MNSYLPITLIQANVCPVCKQQDVLDFKSHLKEKHPEIIAYHLQKQTLEYIRRISKWMA